MKTLVSLTSINGSNTALPSNMVSNGSVHFDPLTDELLIEINNQSVLSLRPGRAFAEGIAALMAKVAVADTPAASGKATTPCPRCNQPVVKARLAVKGEVLLDPEPNERGVYVFMREGRVRSLRPFEDPMSATYRKHRCEGGL